MVADELKQGTGEILLDQVVAEDDEQSVDAAAGRGEASVGGDVLAALGQQRRVGRQVGREDPLRLGFCLGEGLDQQDGEAGYLARVDTQVAIGNLAVVGDEFAFGLGADQVVVPGASSMALRLLALRRCMYILRTHR
ncbi:hypothetical protein ABZ070_29230 [Streptomyces sp. NPDC006283]|uniref:hypothetical protein n=1 Tax=Streptomyces sp. NPDC006283 TaxID=3156741 RepID=UPI0033A06C8C